mmetsp:Transcript_27540/g.46888  ORF Transcript_27540/g.46888 Transcript_27540/m.46888 type:complete len:94 (-) Transcript_27540:945-1226(-)
MFYHGQGIIFIFQKREHYILAMDVTIAIGIPPELARTLLAVNITSSLTLDSWYCLLYTIRIISARSPAQYATVLLLRNLSEQGVSYSPHPPPG